MVTYAAFVHLGPLTVSLFGLTALAGLAAAMVLAGRGTARFGLPRESAGDLIFAAGVGAVVLGKLWPWLQGGLVGGVGGLVFGPVSSLGAALGGAAGLGWALWRSRLAPRPALESLLAPLAGGAAVALLGWDRYGPAWSGPGAVQIGGARLLPLPLLAALGSWALFAWLWQGPPREVLPRALAGGGAVVLLLDEVTRFSLLSIWWPLAALAVGGWRWRWEGGSRMQDGVQTTEERQQTTGGPQSGGSRWRGRGLIIGVVAVLILGGAAAWALKAPAKVQVGPLPGMTAPNFTLPELSGGSLSLASLRGHPVYVNIWATWCPPCRAEIPNLIRLKKQYGSRLTIVGVAEPGTGVTPASVAAFVKQEKMNYPVLLDLSAQVGNQYLVSAIPTSIFINAKGQVVQRFTGEMTLPLMRQYVKSILP
ncbi:MAG: TlpA disulfide reductase family protein [Thermaerobacter sp.]|jgi:thiol-disulfide isomerase/thioredoxin|nr:TlpA disulfide reductase family protein [Thermaerobacter sp.]